MFKAIGPGLLAAAFLFGPGTVLGVSGEAPGNAGQGGAASTEAAVLCPEPVERPAFRELTKGEDFDLRLAFALSRLNRHEMEKTRMPVWGIEANEVFNGGLGSAAGIRPGDFLLTLDGTKLRSIAHLESLRDAANGAQKLACCRPLGGDITVTLQPGKLGAACEERWNPVLRYLRGDRRDKRWDDFVLAAADHFDGDPDLAETAWQRALAAGCKPDFLSDAIGACIASRQERHEEALRFLHLAFKAEPDPEDAKPLWEVARVSSMAIGRFDVTLLAMRKLGRSDSWEYEEIRKVQAAWDRLPEAERKGPSPAQVADGRAHRDLLPQAEPMTSAAKDYLGQLAKGEAVTLRVDKRKFISLAYGPAVRNLDFEVTFAAKPLDYEPHEKARYLTVGVMDDSVGQSGNARLGYYGDNLCVIAADGKLAEVGHDVTALKRSMPDFPGLRLNLRTINKVRIVILGGRAEASLNDRRVFLGPRPKSEQVRTYLQTSGLELKLIAVRISEVLDQPEKDRAKDGLGKPDKKQAR